jgi:hypothetical protein
VIPRIKDANQRYKKRQDYRKVKVQSYPIGTEEDITYMTGAIEAEDATKCRAVDALLDICNLVQDALDEAALSHGAGRIHSPKSWAGGFENQCWRKQDSSMCQMR